ncbi:hypothetical protein BY996DRAFT_7608677 [Phakopsora pachyrhizi]|nr:hypothetical protein BY996DRAFT_7608677 [Phakopsora pachyrhizi]
MVNRFNPGHQEPTTVRRIDQTEHQHSHSHTHTHSQQQNQSKLSQNHQTNKIQKFNNTSHRSFRNRKGSKTMFYNQISTNEHTQPIDETSPPTVRSHYHLSRDELVRGIANRLIFSQVYIYVYLTMIILSLMTILVSILSSHCGSVTFYVLEVLINTAMILEVSIRLVAFGKLLILEVKVKYIGLRDHCDLPNGRGPGCDHPGRSKPYPIHPIGSDPEKEWEEHLYKDRTDRSGRCDSQCRFN